MNDPFICKYCGAHITEETVNCEYCGSQIRYRSQAETRSVPEKVTVPYAGKKPLSKWVAFLLCLFLGSFGAHKFYEGNAEMGIVYIFTFGLFGIGWIMDIFTILSKPDPYYV